MAFVWTDATDAERRVAAAAAAGERVDFTAGDGWSPDRLDTWPEIRGAFLRHLMMGLPAERGAPAPIAPPGVRIKGARVVGALDLADAAGEPGLPALALERCAIPERIDLSNARLQRLSIDDSLFREIWAPGVTLNGPFGFSRATPHPADDDAEATVHIFMRGATIEGEVRGEGATLTAPESENAATGHPFSAMELVGAQIGGDVFLRKGFTATGVVWLAGATIGGDLDCHDATFTNPRAADDVDAPALNAQGAQIGGQVFLSQGFAATGVVWLAGATIGGDLDCRDATVTNPRAADDANAQALTAQGAQIGGQVFLSQGFAATGVVGLTGATIGGALDCHGATVTNPRAKDDANSQALNAESAQIGGHVFLRQGFTSTGAVRLAGATIGGAFEVHGGRFIHPLGQHGRSALNLWDARVDGDVIADIGATRINGAVSLERVVIGGAARLSGLELTRAPIAAEDGAAPTPLPDGIKDLPPTLDFTDARIAHGLDMKGLDTPNGAVIDLTNAQARVLDDDLEAGWGDRSVTLRLDGFTYDHLENPGGGAKGGIAKARLTWLKRQETGAFAPQPYEHLAAVLAAQGHFASARKVLIAARKRRGLPLVTRIATLNLWPWGFSFGLSPTRAVITLVLLYLAGLAGAQCLKTAGLLEVDTTAVVIAEGASGAPGPLARLPDDPPCGDRINPALYALDVAVPLLDLGEERQCEIVRGHVPEGMHPWSPGAARWAKAAYKLLALLVISLAILTFSGVMRREIER